MSGPRKRKCIRCGLQTIHMIKPTIQDKCLTMTLKWMCWPCFCDGAKIPLTNKLKKEMNELWLDEETK